MKKFSQYVENAHTSNTISNMVHNAIALNKLDETIVNVARTIVDNTSDAKVIAQVEQLMEAGFFQGLGNLAGRTVQGFKNAGANMAQGYQQGVGQGQNQQSQTSSTQAMQLLQQLNQLVMSDNNLKQILGNNMKAMSDAMQKQVAAQQQPQSAMDMSKLSPQQQNQGGMNMSNLAKASA